MKAPLNEVLSTKFAAELVEMITRFKEKKPHNLDMASQVPNPEDVQYFIPTSALKAFLTNCRNNIRIIIPLSVTQYYHQGPHSASQIACLENLRESYEQWLVEQIQNEAVSADHAVKMKYRWPVELLSADSSQALNVFPSIEVDSHGPTDQCIRLLTHNELKPLEQNFVTEGQVLGKQYRNLFQKEKEKNPDGNNISVRFKVIHKMQLWIKLKQHYEDPLFVEMVNYLEACFKCGINIIDDQSVDPTKLPGDVRKLKAKGLFADWQKRVKVNDIAYVIAEIVMMHYKFLNRGASLGEQEHRFILYPGPLDMILSTGKNMLAVQYAKYLDNQECSFLRMMQVNNKGDNPDAHSQLFLGRLTPLALRVLPDEGLSLRRKRFIHNEVGEQETLRVKLSFFQQREQKISRQELRRKQDFESGPYCKFLNNFFEEYLPYGAIVEKLCSESELTWLTEKPIACMLQFCKTLLDRDDAIQLDGFCLKQLHNLQDQFEELHDKYLETPSDTKRKSYLKRAACYLVEVIVSSQKNYEPQNTQSKRAKAIADEVSSQPFFVNVINVEPKERFIAGLYYFLENITQFCLNVTTLKDPDYYPDDHAPVDYRSTQSTQESLSGSVPEGYSLSQSK